MKALPTVWTKHLKADSQQREQLETLLRNNSLLFSRLLTLLEEEEKSISLTETSIDDFSDPSWSHKQAFRNGQRSTIKKLKDLIAFAT